MLRWEVEMNELYRKGHIARHEAEGVSSWAVRAFRRLLESENLVQVESDYIDNIKAEAYEKGWNAGWDAAYEAVDREVSW